MATGSDNDFADVTEELTLEKIKIWTMKALRHCTKNEAFHCRLLQ